MVTCLNAFPEPVGTSCADRFTRGGGDELAARVETVAPAFDRTLGAIAEKAPNAEIVVVGYGTYLRPGGCPIWARDADYVQSSVISGMLADTASRHGARFVDVAPISREHDVCAATADKYFEGLVPSSVAAPLHPNARGMAAFGNAVAAAVQASSS